jgi:hypothetical protein
MALGIPRQRFLQLVAEGRIRKRRLPCDGAWPRYHRADALKVLQEAVTGGKPEAPRRTKQPAGV